MSENQRRPGDPARRAAPARAEGTTIRPAAAVLLGLEALLIAALAVFCVLSVLGGALAARFGLGLAAFLLLFAVLGGLAARSVLARGRFGLGWGITWQLFQALVGASLLRGGLLWQGGVAIVLALAVFVLLTRLVTTTPLPRRED